MAAPTLSIVSNVDSGSSGSTGVTTRAVTRGAVQKGDLIVAVVQGNVNANISSVVDAAQSNFSMPNAASTWDATDANFFAIYYEQAAVADSGGTVTATFSSSTQFAEISVGIIRPSGLAFVNPATLAPTAQGQLVVGPGTGAGAIATPTFNGLGNYYAAFGFTQDINGSLAPTRANGSAAWSWHGGLSSYQIVSQGPVNETFTAASVDGGATFTAIQVLFPFSPSIFLHNHGDVSSSTGSTSIVFSGRSSMNAGDLLIAWVSGNINSNIASVVDSLQGKLQPVPNASAWDSTDSNFSQLWYVIAQSSDAGNASITVNYSNSTTFREITWGIIQCFGGTFSATPVGSGNILVNPGNAAGAMTAPLLATPIDPTMIIGFNQDITGTGHNAPAGPLSGGGNWTFNPNNGSVGFAQVHSTPSQVAFTSGGDGTTNTFSVTSAAFAINVVSPIASLFDVPAAKPRTVLVDSLGSAMELLTVVAASAPPFPISMDMPPTKARLHISVTTTGEQQQEVTGALYGQDRVLAPTQWNYKWQTGVAAMPAALRSDYNSLGPLVLTATQFQLPPGEADQAYAGRRVLANPSYEFSMPLTIFGKDTTPFGVGAPFFTPDWPVPRAAQRALSLYDTAPAMDALYTFSPPRPPINQEDWTVPLFARRPVQDWIQGTPDTMLSLLTTFPFSQTDWPNPVQPRYPIFLRQLEENENIADLQRISTPPPGQGLSPDWPNPLVAKRSIDLFSITFYNEVILSTVPVSGGHVGRIVFPSKRLSDVAGLPFDFISALAPGETIVSATVTVSMYSGIDPSPSAILNAAPIAVGTVATQFVGQGSSAVGNIYTLLCKATSSLSKSYTMAGYLAIEPDVP